jgi:F420-0:gamma-glutamyl ligase
MVHPLQTTVAQDVVIFLHRIVSLLQELFINITDIKAGNTARRLGKKKNPGNSFLGLLRKALRK